MTVLTVMRPLAKEVILFLVEAAVAIQRRD